MVRFRYNKYYDSGDCVFGCGCAELLMFMTTDPSAAGFGMAGLDFEQFTCAHPAAGIVSFFAASCCEKGAGRCSGGGGATGVPGTTGADPNTAAASFAAAKLAATQTAAAYTDAGCDKNAAANGCADLKKALDAADAAVVALAAGSNATTPGVRSTARATGPTTATTGSGAGSNAAVELARPFVALLSTAMVLNLFIVA